MDTVSRIQKDMTILREENRLLGTPAASQVVQAPRRAALTTTKVPQFDRTTSWEQYHQVFEAIVRSNGWDNDTAALHLFSHLEGDALNVAHLVPLARRLSRSGSVDALTATMVRWVDWRTTGASLKGNFRNSFRNVSCEGFWRHGTDGPITSDSGSIYSWS